MTAQIDAPPEFNVQLLGKVKKYVLIINVFTMEKRVQSLCMRSLIKMERNGRYEEPDKYDNVKQMGKRR